MAFHSLLWSYQEAMVWKCWYGRSLSPRSTICWVSLCWIKTNKVISEWSRVMRGVRKFLGRLRDLGYLERCERIETCIGERLRSTTQLLCQQNCQLMEWARRLNCICICIKRQWVQESTRQDDGKETRRRLVATTQRGDDMNRGW